MGNCLISKLDILVTGVGGQGVVLASDILGELGVSLGYDVKKSDTLGMAQRGGSVVAHIRMGQAVASPLIPKGEADCLLSLEKLETVRWADYIKTGGAVVYNDQTIPPLSVSRGEATYPDDDFIALTLSSYTRDFFAIPGEKLVTGLGNPKVLNILMLGALSMFMPFSQDAWDKAIAPMVPEKAVEVNLEAFLVGRQEIRRQIEEAVAQDDYEAYKAMKASHSHDDCGC